MLQGEADLTVITQVYHFQHIFRANLINNLVTISYGVYQAASFTFDVVTAFHRNRITFLANKVGRHLPIVCVEAKCFVWTSCLLAGKQGELKSLYVLNACVDL